MSPGPECLPQNWGPRGGVLDVMVGLHGQTAPKRVTSQDRDRLAVISDVLQLNMVIQLEGIFSGHWNCNREEEELFIRRSSYIIEWKLSMQINPMKPCPSENSLWCQTPDSHKFSIQGIVSASISYINILTLLWGNQMIRSSENFNFIRGPPIS